MLYAFAYKIPILRLQEWSEYVIDFHGTNRIWTYNFASIASQAINPLFKTAQYFHEIELWEAVMNWKRKSTDRELAEYYTPFLIFVS